MSKDYWRLKKREQRAKKGSLKKKVKADNQPVGISDGVQREEIAIGTISHTYSIPCNLNPVPVLAEPPLSRNSIGKSSGIEGGEARESTQPIVDTEQTRKGEQASDSRGGIQTPLNVPEKEWRLAVERALRAKKYADMFPDFVKPHERKFQDPLWQWENEVRGRFGGVIGGSLSGSRNQQV